MIIDRKITLSFMTIIHKTHLTYLINEKLLVLVPGEISNRDEKSNGRVARGSTVSFVK